MHSSCYFYLARWEACKRRAPHSARRAWLGRAPRRGPEGKDAGLDFSRQALGEAGLTRQNLGAFFFGESTPLFFVLGLKGKGSGRECGYEF